MRSRSLAENTFIHSQRSAEMFYLLANSGNLLMHSVSIIIAGVLCARRDVCIRSDAT
jgi:hypothetical protein